MLNRRKRSVIGATGAMSLGVLVAAVIGQQHPASAASSAVDPETTMKKVAVEVVGAEPTNIRWVKSTRAKGVAFMSDGSQVDGDQAAPVYVVEADGEFVLQDAQPGRARPHGSQFTIVIDEKSGSVTDFGLSYSPLDLSELGNVSFSTK